MDHHYTLYYAPGACSLAVHITLEWLGKPYVARRVATGSDELRRLNPSGAVPVLQRDDGWVLNQAGAILHYLARQSPEAQLGGDGTPEGEAELDRWSSYFTGDLHPSFYPLFMPERYTTARESDALDAVREAGRALVSRQLTRLEDQLAAQDFILGARRSVLDAYAFPMLRWAEGQLAGGLQAFPKVQAFKARLAQDPAVVKVLAVERQPI